MTFDIEGFRAAFPEFSNTTDYPTATITFWAELAVMQVRPDVWKCAWSKGVSLYVAHQLVLARSNAKAAAVGGTPGTFGGVANAKTVGGASVGYDSTSTSEKDAGWWNLTNYGKQFWSLVQIFGCRPVVV